MEGSFTGEYFWKGKPLLLSAAPRKVTETGKLQYYSALVTSPVKITSSKASFFLFSHMLCYGVCKLETIRKNIYDVGISWKISIFKCAFGKIARISLNKGMYSCHHVIIPEVMFAVNTSTDENHYLIIYWSVKINTNNLWMGEWVRLYVFR